MPKYMYICFLDILPIYWFMTIIFLAYIIHIHIYTLFITYKMHFIPLVTLLMQCINKYPKTINYPSIRKKICIIIWTTLELVWCTLTEQEHPRYQVPSTQAHYFFFFFECNLLNPIAKQVQSWIMTIKV